MTALAIIAGCTALSLILRPYVAPTNLVTVFLLGVVAVSVRCGRGISIVASVVSVAAFDFFCVPPYLTLQVSDYEYLITFLGMLVVALVISTQTARIRKQAMLAVEREARAENMYRLSRRLAAETRIFDVARTAAECAQEAVGTPVVIFLADDHKVTFARRTSGDLSIPRQEQTAAQWAFEHGEKSGRGTQVDGGSTALYLPLKGATESFGVMAVIPPGSGALPPEQTQLLEMFASQTASAMERTRSQNAAEAARLRMQTEEMRSSLLSAVSHDLRTPLASITGAASTLRFQDEKLPSETRKELLESIADEAERLSRLVSNLLDMTRLESGVELRRDLYPLEEILGAAMQRMESRMGGRQVATHVPDDLPLIFVDDVLFGQVIVNVLENAVKYTRDGTAIEIAAEAAGTDVIIEIRDRGPGFSAGEEHRIFEKFYRGNPKSAPGAGLGLAICRAIVQAHHGTIEACNRSGGGAVFRIHLRREDGL